MKDAADDAADAVLVQDQDHHSSVILAEADGGWARRAKQPDDRLHGWGQVRPDLRLTAVAARDHRLVLQHGARRWDLSEVRLRFGEPPAPDRRVVEVLDLHGVALEVVDYELSEPHLWGRRNNPTWDGIDEEDADLFDFLVRHGGDVAWHDRALRIWTEGFGPARPSPP